MTLVNSTLVDNLAGGGGPAARWAGRWCGRPRVAWAAAVARQRWSAVPARSSTRRSRTTPLGLVARPRRARPRAASAAGSSLSRRCPRENSRLANTIVASNTGGQCAGTGHGAITSDGHNLSFGDRTCPGAHADPKLGSLADNGGPTETLALRRGSPAINQSAKAGRALPGHRSAWRQAASARRVRHRRVRGRRPGDHDPCAEQPRLLRAPLPRPSTIPL